MSRFNEPKIISKDVKENGMIDSVKSSTNLYKLTQGRASSAVVSQLEFPVVRDIVSGAKRQIEELSNDGARTSRHDFKSHVGIGWSGHEALDHLRISLQTSSAD